MLCESSSGVVHDIWNIFISTLGYVQATAAMADAAVEIAKNNNFHHEQHVFTLLTLETILANMEASKTIKKDQNSGRTSA